MANVEFLNEETFKQKVFNYEKNKDVFAGLLPVFFNRKPEGIEADVIINDDHKMLFASTEHLINLGHKKIAFVNGPLELSSFNFRQKGYLDAMSKYKLPVNEELIINGDFSINIRQCSSMMGITF